MNLHVEDGVKWGYKGDLDNLCIMFSAYGIIDGPVKLRAYDKTNQDTNIKHISKNGHNQKSLRHAVAGPTTTTNNNNDHNNNNDNNDNNDNSNNNNTDDDDDNI